MKKSLRFNSYTFQFILLVLINFSFGSILFLVLRSLNLMVASPDEPLGAEESFILYNNLLKSLCAIVIIHFYKIYDDQIKNKFYRYALLAFSIYTGTGLINLIIGALLQQNLSIWNVFWIPGGVVVFRLNIVLGALLVYHWSRREEKRDLEILQHKLELSTLQELKSRAELEALQAKINPHFLYNSLNSINSLVDHKPEKAKEMIVLLSKLFRLSVNSKSDLRCALKEELDLVVTYLAIEKIRFGEKLQYSIDCDPALMNERIPKFLIQPLIENAILHGTSKLATEGRVQIDIHDKGEFLEFKISDNGQPFKPNFEPGYGLQSIYDKVKLLGGKDSSFQIVNNNDERQNKYVAVKLRKSESNNC